MRQASSGQTGKKSILVAGLGAAFVSAFITAAMLASNPSPPASPVQTAEPAAKACQRESLMQFVSTENGGGGTIRLREGDYLSPPIKLGSSPQAVVFPKFRPETAPLKETIIVEGDATNLVLGPEGDHVVIPRVQGTYSYTMTWSPRKC